LEAVFDFVQRKVTVTENDGVGGRKASTQARQPAFGGPGVVSDCDDSPADLDLQLGRQRTPQQRLVDIAVNGMDDRAERPHFLQRRDGEEVAGMDDRLRCRDHLDAVLGQPTGSLGQVGVGEDGDQGRQILMVANAGEESRPSSARVF
jgi:hypothetical protein